MPAREKLAKFHQIFWRLYDMVRMRLTLVAIVILMIRFRSKRTSIDDIGDKDKLNCPQYPPGPHFVPKSQTCHAVLTEKWYGLDLKLLLRAFFVFPSVYRHGTVRHVQPEPWCVPIVRLRIVSCSALGCDSCPTSMLFSDDDMLINKTFWALLLGCLYRLQAGQVPEDRVNLWSYLHVHFRDAL